MKAFISGGCKNGKSSWAENLAQRLAGDSPLYYIATMIPCDAEDHQRIEKHRLSRAGKGFCTLEQPTRIHQVLDYSDYARGTYLLDSVTALMLNEMYPRNASLPDVQAPDRVCHDLSFLLAQAKNVVLVSDYIYSDTGHYSKYTQDYCKALAQVDRHLARICDTVVEMSAHQPIYYKGGNL